MRKALIILTVSLIGIATGATAIYADISFWGAGTWTGPNLNGSRGTATQNPNGTVHVECSGTGNCTYTTDGGHTLWIKTVADLPNGGFDPGDPDQDQGTFTNN